MARKLHGDPHPTSINAMEVLGRVLLQSGDLDKAEEMIRLRLEVSRRASGEEGAAAIEAAIDLAALHTRRHRWAEAETLLLHTREPARRIGPHLEAGLLGHLGILHTEMGRYPEAERELLLAEGEFGRGRAGATGLLINVKLSLANVYMFGGRTPRANEERREALSLCEAHYGEEHSETFRALADLATGCRMAGRLDEAEALFSRAVSLGQRVLGPENENVIANQGNYATLLHARGRFVQAELRYREVLEGLRRTRGPDDQSTLMTLSNLGELYRDWGRYDRAEAVLKQALDAEVRSHGPGHTLTLWTLWKTAEMDRDRGRLNEAEAKFLRCLEGYAKVQKPDSLDIATLRADLGLTYLKKVGPDKADPLFREALRVYDRQMPDDWRRFEIQGQLGESLVGQKKYAEAEPLVLSGYEGMTARRKDVTVDAWPRVSEPGRRVVRLYEAWGKSEKAAEWRKRLEIGHD